MEVKDQENAGQEQRLDLNAVREKLAGKSGKQYWRSLEEVVDTPAFDKFLEDEFPNRSTLGQINRRDLLKFMGASMALAGLSGCRGVFLPQEKLVPFVKAPEEMVPGQPLYYASSVFLGGYATGVLVEQHEGRPTRLEGNPLHPASLGALDSLSQAEILNLYDPDRATNVTLRGDISTWELFGRTMRDELTKARATQGAGIRILTGAVSSPTVVDLLQAFLKQYPAARWHWHEPVGRGAVHEGAQLAFGRPLEPIYDFSQAQTVLSVDGDFFSPTAMPGSLRYARQFMDRRRVHGFTTDTLPGGAMNRLYVFESTPTLVGATADHRWPVPPQKMHALLLAVASALGLGWAQGGDPAGIDPQHIQALADDLRQNSGLVVVGDFCPKELHAVAHAINQAIGAVGRSVRYVEPINAAVTQASDLASLVADIDAGAVDTLIVLGGNPAYDAPGDLKFADRLKKVQFRVHHTLYENETSLLCDWVLPSTHFLEEWGDGRAFDGTVSVVQPLLAPLYEGRSTSELLASLLGRPRGSYDLVRDFWRRRGVFGGDFEAGWRSFVHDGVLPNSASGAGAAPANVFVGDGMTTDGRSGMAIVFRPDPTIYDGRYANNGWLQELPKPLTKMTWDNTAIVSPALALKLGVLTDDVVRLTHNGASVDAGVFIQPGQPDDTVTVHLGYGRTAGGVVATATGDEGGGFNAYILRSSQNPYYDVGVQIEKVGGQVHLATTQIHQPIEASKRPPAIEGSVIPQFEGDHREILLEFDIRYFLEHGKHELEKRQKRGEEYRRHNLFPEEIFEWDGEQWAMTVDMNTCIGCNACVTACQSENNIPVVGKVQVNRHREMHWLRIDRYYKGDSDNPQITWQPMLCVHCEKAPCEPVCPVAATVHSHDGLNQMIYNRCVGTRYCSNNCPYKVRRFNYLNFTDNQPQFDVRKDDKQRRPLLKMLNNPDVTVRGRGVMEKCTYCVQRINNARIEAKKTNSPIRDGDILTACQQACPTQTIVFGNQADKTSRVRALREDPRAYLVLEELQTRPRTSHLAKLRNPNPAIAGPIQPGPTDTTLGQPEGSH